MGFPISSGVVLGRRLMGCTSDPLLVLPQILSDFKLKFGVNSRNKPRNSQRTPAMHLPTSNRLSTCFLLLLCCCKSLALIFPHSNNNISDQNHICHDGCR